MQHIKLLNGYNVETGHMHVEVDVEQYGSRTDACTQIATYPPYFAKASSFALFTKQMFAFILLPSHLLLNKYPVDFLPHRDC